MSRRGRVPQPTHESSSQLAAMRAAMLRGHQRRCPICAGGSGVYQGHCLSAVVLERELRAARLALHAVSRPPTGA